MYYETDRSVRYSLLGHTVGYRIIVVLGDNYWTREDRDL